jgi:hypothetical protein
MSNDWCSGWSSVLALERIEVQSPRRAIYFQYFYPPNFRCGLFYEILVANNHESPTINFWELQPRKSREMF